MRGIEDGGWKIAPRRFRYPQSSIFDPPCSKRRTRHAVQLSPRHGGHRQASPGETIANPPFAVAHRRLGNSQPLGYLMLFQTADKPLLEKKPHHAGQLQFTSDSHHRAPTKTTAEYKVSALTAPPAACFVHVHLAQGGDKCRGLVRAKNGPRRLHRLYWSPTFVRSYSF